MVPEPVQHTDCNASYGQQRALILKEIMKVMITALRAQTDMLSMPLQTIEKKGMP